MEIAKILDVSIRQLLLSHCRRRCRYQRGSMLSHLGYFSQLAILLRSVLYFASPSAGPTGLICSVAVKATVDEKSSKKSFHPCVGYENNALLAGCNDVVRK